MDYVFLFARSYRPRGVMVVLLEFTYSVTDPPLKLLRRFIPPLRLGGVAIDLSFLVLFILVQILLSVAGSLCPSADAVGPALLQPPARCPCAVDPRGRAREAVHDDTAARGVRRGRGRRVPRRGRGRAVPAAVRERRSHGPHR